MKKKEKKEINLDNLDLCKAATPSDCTGLIQVPPMTNEEYQAYNKVYDFAPDMPVDLEKNREDN